MTNEKKDDGGHAFPQVGVRMVSGEKMIFPEGGLTKRDIFAMTAMQGMLACPPFDSDGPRNAKIAVENADALIAELKK